MSSVVLQPRQTYKAPSHPDGGRSLPPTLDFRVYLRHPGYSDGGNILMVLPALDHPDGGLHHETARLACAIIANNRWDGFLSESRSGRPVNMERDGILRGKNYYFRVSEDDAAERYAVIPSFAHWRFPHDNMPASWTESEIPRLPLERQLPRQSSLAEATLARDISCRVTQYAEGTEHAHLVPRSEEKWFRENGMFRYTDQQRPGTEPIDDAQNAILLRSDIHTIFDQKRLAIVLKSDTFLMHVLAPGSLMQLANLYHNVLLQPLVGVSVPYIFARFAWSMFAQTINFVQQGLRRTLCVCRDDGETHIMEFSGEQCQELMFPPNKSRSSSPRKRQREQIIASVDERSCRQFSDCDNDESGEERGRKRIRSQAATVSMTSSLSEGFWSQRNDTASNTDTDNDVDTSPKFTQSNKLVCNQLPQARERHL